MVAAGPRSCNLRVADDCDLMGGGSDSTFQDLANRQPQTERGRMGMEVSKETSKIMTNSTNNISADFSMNGQRLEDVTTFNTWEQPCAKMAPAQQKSASDQRLGGKQDRLLCGST